MNTSTNKILLKPEATTIKNLEVASKKILNANIPHSSNKSRKIISFKEYFNNRHYR